MLIKLNYSLLNFLLFVTVPRNFLVSESEYEIRFRLWFLEGLLKIKLKPPCKYFQIWILNKSYYRDEQLWFWVVIFIIFICYLKPIPNVKACLIYLCTVYVYRLLTVKLLTIELTHHFCQYFLLLYTTSFVTHLGFRHVCYTK